MTRTEVMATEVSVETEGQGPVMLLLSRAFKCKAVPREAIGDTFGSALKVLGSVVGTSVLITMVVLLPAILANDGVFASVLILYSILGLLVCSIGGGIFSYLNCMIAGCKHGWREYQIFVSAAIWICAIKASIFVAYILGMPVLVLLGIVLSSFMAGYYVSLNYRSKLLNEGGWQVGHQIYATIALGMMMACF